MINFPAHILLVEDNRMDAELTLNAFHEARLSNTITACRHSPNCR